MPHSMCPWSYGKPRYRSHHWEHGSLSSFNRRTSRYPPWEHPIPKYSHYGYK